MEGEHFAYIPIYKTNQPIKSTQQLPIPSQQRIPTDLFCTIITSISAIGMLVAAFVCLDLGKLQRMTYPTDQQGRHCTLDNSNYNYLYFTSGNDPSKRLCVSQCPSGHQQRLDCWPTQDLSCAKNNNPPFQVAIYPSKPKETSLGLFCEAQDPLFNNQLLQNANLVEMHQFVAAYRSIGISFLFALLFGIIGVIAFATLPRAMSYFSVVFGGIGCIVAAIFLIIADSALLSGYKIAVTLFSIILGFVGVLLLYSSIWRQKDIKLTIDFLQEGSQCFWEFPSLGLISFVFVVLLLGLTALCGFQVLAYWSSSNMQLNPNSVYYRPNGGFAVFMTVLNIIEFIWGLSFLKEAFNMIVSGTTVSWYFRKSHSLMFGLSNLFKFHWGSVAGGAFLLHLLYPIDIVYDIFKPSQNDHGPYRKFCCCCEKLFDLARSQAMVLINIVGMPYCNASRWCEKILYHSKQFEGNSSANRFVRIGGHMALSLLSTLVGYLYMKSNNSVSVLALVLSFIVNIFALTFFVCLLKDITQSIFFCDTLEEYYENQNESVAKKLFPQGYQIIPTDN